MSEPMPYGEMVQKLTHLRAQYEQFIIDRERERIIKLLEAGIENCACGFFDCSLNNRDFVLKQAIAFIKGENK